MSNLQVMYHAVPILQNGDHGTPVTRGSPRWLASCTVFMLQLDLCPCVVTPLMVSEILKPTPIHMSLSSKSLTIQSSTHMCPIPTYIYLIRPSSSRTCTILVVSQPLPIPAHYPCRLYTFYLRVGFIFKTT
jgi:hypothetical protein